MKTTTISFGIALLLTGCFESLNIENRHPDVEKRDTEENANTVVDPTGFCPKRDDSVCEALRPEPIVPLAFSLDALEIPDSKIFTVNASLRDQSEEQGYLIGATAVGRLDGEMHPFLVVFRSSDASQYTVNWLTAFGGDVIIHGLRGGAGGRRWAAVVCAQSCTVVGSSATEDTPDPLQPLTSIQTFDLFEVKATARTDTDSPLCVVGDGIACLENSSTWRALVPAGTGPLFRAAYLIHEESLVAVGDQGRITHIKHGEVTELTSGMSDRLSSVWARYYIEGTGFDSVLIVYAFGEGGHAYLTDHKGVGRICPFVQDVVATFRAFYSIVVATRQGDIYEISRSVRSRTQCLTGSFAGSVVDAKSFFCDAGANFIGWNEQQVFAPAEAYCIIE